MFKLGDFGISRFAPLTRAARANAEWIKGSQWRAARQWMSPVSPSIHCNCHECASNDGQEQFFENHRNRDISSATNVWAMGAVLHRLITREPLDPTSIFVHRADPSPGEMAQRKSGPNSVSVNQLLTHLKQLLEIPRFSWITQSALTVQPLSICYADV